MIRFDFSKRLRETALAPAQFLPTSRSVKSSFLFFPSSLFRARVLSVTSRRIVFIVWRTGKRREGRSVVQREIYSIVCLANVVTLR